MYVTLGKSTTGLASLLAIDEAVRVGSNDVHERHYLIHCLAVVCKHKSCLSGSDSLWEHLPCICLGGVDLMRCHVTQ